jgi:ribonuclease D
MSKEPTSIKLHHGDLPAGLDLGPGVAVDTETMGLNPQRDPLCQVQLSSGDGSAHLVMGLPENGRLAAPISRRCWESAHPQAVHFARFDVAALKQYLGVGDAAGHCQRLRRSWCTLYRPHGLKDL